MGDGLGVDDWDGDGDGDGDEVAVGVTVSVTVGVGAGVLRSGFGRVARWPPVRSLTVVPWLVRPQISASSGLPAATSTTVMTPIVTTNMATAAATQMSQRRLVLRPLPGPPGSPAGPAGPIAGIPPPPSPVAMAGNSSVAT